MKLAQVPIPSGVGRIAPGAVLARLRTAPITIVAADSNVGNGSLSLDAVLPADNAAPSGIYRVTCISTGPNDVVRFEVLDPGGWKLGPAMPGKAFEHGIKFILVEGTVPFAVGDSFAVTITPRDGAYMPAIHAHDEARSGAEIAMAVALAGGDATDEDTTLTAIVGDADFDAATLVFDESIVGNSSALERKRNELRRAGIRVSIVDIKDK